jgi:NMD protein affecting ribosome stability and mRNA decay
VNKQQIRKCEKCGKGPIDSYATLCRACSYKASVEYMRSLPRDLQDWTLAHCEECGSSLDSNGQCPNSNCGASPRCGEDWY